MKLGSKVAAVGVVLLAGTVAVLFFRKAPTPTEPAPATANTLPLRDDSAPRPSAGPATPATPQGVPLPIPAPAAAPVSGAPSGPIVPGKSTLPPAPLPPTFPTDSRASANTAPSAKPTLPDLRGSGSNSPPTRSVSEALSGSENIRSSSETVPAATTRPKSIPAPIATEPRSARPAPWRSHTVVDGDTLSALAARYLGASGRYAEILEANRQTLRSPDMLPIGTVLRIPPQSRPEEPASATAPPRQFTNLVPIPEGALERQDQPKGASPRFYDATQTGR